MRYARWAPLYEKIRRDFGFDWARERAAADALKRLIPGTDVEAPDPPWTDHLRGRDAVVVGLAPRAGPPPLWRLGPAERGPALLAADGAAAVCLSAHLVPDLVVTDLDGPVPSEVLAQSRGAGVLVHAHGDNREAIERWLPEFSEPVSGSWAGAPEPGLWNFGGFTDGDRAAYVAEAAGARRVLLWGFDFERPSADELDRPRKLAKLRWARASLAWLSASAPGRVMLWEREGGIRPFPSDQSNGPETQ